MSNPKTMTDQELRTEARAYRQVMLEGGEGYNPYEVERERRAMGYEAPKAPAARRESDILVDLEIATSEITRASGLYDPAEVARLEAELEQVRNS